MKYFSTNKSSEPVTFRQAVIKGLADDGGLFMPEFVPEIESNFIKNLKKYSIAELSFEIASKFIDKSEISPSQLFYIITQSINFPAPLTNLSDTLSVLELFHGPTLAFKDFGARFMARVMSYFIKESDKKFNILVATSGDTGSAVANGFYEAEGIAVHLLYPKNRVSPLQEIQLTTLGKNISAVEIDGNFDDCQRLVKTAFTDNDLRMNINLSSANSINIARLIPQIFYYFEAYKQLPYFNKEVFISVPSGNLGNLTGGLLAKKMGLPVSKFIAATNSNSVFTDYIKSGKYSPRPSIKTYSNAMDVGNPSNLARINQLFQNNISLIRDVIFSSSYSDEQTVFAIKDVFRKFSYILDPHGAVGFLALNDFIKNYSGNSHYGIIVETAHHAKFKDIVESSIGTEIKLPSLLSECLLKQKHIIKLPNDYASFKDYLLRQK